MIELTEQQQRAVKNGEAIRVPVPEIGEDVVLLRATQYERMRELLEDEREQRAVLRYSMKEAAKVAAENPLLNMAHDPLELHDLASPYP